MNLLIRSQTRYPLRHWPATTFMNKEILGSLLYITRSLVSQIVRHASVNNLYFNLYLNSLTLRDDLATVNPVSYAD